MENVDFYRFPAVAPAQYSEEFSKQNKKGISSFQKNFKTPCHFDFKIRRLFYLLKAYAKKEFYIGQSNEYTSIGDTVIHSHLPGLIKSLSPSYKVYVYDSPLARIVFMNNPYIDGFTKDDRRLWRGKGSRGDYGSGHLTQMKARFWGIKTCFPKGDLFISPGEKADVSNLPLKPIATLQAHGKTISSPITDTVWGDVVGELKKTHYVIQLKSPDEKTIVGVDQTMSGIRACIVQQSAANIHVGIDSGFTHTATALSVPAVVILDRISVNTPFLKQGIHQLVLPQIKGRGLDFLYPQNTYLCVGPATPKAPALSQMTLRMAVDGKIYPFHKESVWNI